MNRNLLYFIGGGLVGAVASGLVTYYVTRKRTADLYTEIAVEKIEAEREYFQNLQKQRDADEEERNKETHQMTFDEYAEVIIGFGYGGDSEDLKVLFDRGIPVYEAMKEVSNAQTEDETPEEPEEEFDDTPHNIFRDNDKLEIDDPELAEYEEFIKDRDPKKPYIIHINEFMGRDSNGFDKIPVNYYTEDDTLTDERNRPIPDVERLVGDDNLNHFGKFSMDRNLLYVRNERPDVMSDFEIRRHELSYADAILGVTSRDPIPKMREDDE